MPLHGIVLVKLGHPSTRASDLGQVDVDLVPPGATEAVVWESDITMARGSVEGGGGDYAGRELKTQDGEHGVIDEGPGSVPEGLVLVDAEKAGEVVEDAIGLLKLQIEAESL